MQGVKGTMELLATPTLSNTHIYLQASEEDEDDP